MLLSEIFQPLPDVFVGVKLYLPEEGVADRDVLERYFVAYPFTHKIISYNVTIYFLACSISILFSFPLSGLHKFSHYNLGKLCCCVNNRLYMLKVTGGIFGCGFKQGVKWLNASSQCVIL